MSQSRSAQRDSRWFLAGVRSALFALPLIFLALFYFYPLLTILEFSFREAGRAASGFGAILRDAYFAGVLWFSAWQATLSTLLTLLAGLPAAYVFARYEFRGKTLLRALATVPFVLPTVVVAAAFAALLGPGGVLNAVVSHLVGRPNVLNLQHTLTLILLSHVFYNFTVVLRIVGGFWANLDPGGGWYLYAVFFF